jgi:hypothetical protein
MTKTKLLLAALAAATSMSVNAQSGGNGYFNNGYFGNGYDPNNGNIQMPGSGATQIVPNGNGGYNVYDPNANGAVQIVPNGNGGYNVYDPNR